MKILAGKQIVTLVVATLILISPLQAAKQASARGRQAADDLIKVGEDRPVDIGAAKLIAVEPHLAADPRDAKHLVAGVMLVTRLGDPRRPVVGFDEHVCAALTSSDAGRTWARHDFPLKECIDPWVAILNDGSAVFLGIGSWSGKPGMFAFRSPDGGRTWGDKPVSFGGGHDHGTLAVDTSSGPFAGSLYVASHQSQPTGRGKPQRDAAFVVRSSDGGASFQEPARVIPSNLSTYALNPVVLSDGLLVAPFINFLRRKPENDYAFFQRAPSWVVTSADGGKTFSTPMFVTNACADTWPALASDASGGPYRDRLYYVRSEESRV